MHFDFAQCKQKGSAVIFVLIGILILVGIAGGAYFFGKISNKPISTPSSVTQTQPTKAVDETANWKTYSNQLMGISFKYPASYKLRETTSSQTTFKGVGLEKDATYTLGGGQYDSNVLKTGVVISFVLRSSKDLSEATLKNEYGSGVILQKKILGQKEGIEVVFPNQGNNQPKHIFYILDSNILDISLDGGFETTPEQYSSYVSDFDQILSTFKFTPASSAGGGQNQGGNYKIGGSFTEKATEAEISSLSNKLGSNASSISLLESFPLQFQITSPSEASCGKAKKALSAFKFVDSVGDCQKVEAGTSDDSNQSIISQ